MKSYGINPNPECPLYACYVDEFAALRELTLPSALTVLFIAADTSALSADLIYEVADNMLKRGVIWVCTLGAGLPTRARHLR